MTKLKMADAEYFALDRLSFSSGKYLLDSPRKYLLQKKRPFKGNDATELGTAIHMWLQGTKDKIIFEPDLSQIKTKEGAIAKNPRMTNEGKALIEACEADKPKDCVLVPFETRALLEEVEQQFKANPQITELINQIIDVEGAYLFETMGVKFKGKLDFEGKDFIVDLKSTGKSATWKSFKRTISDSDYDLQAAVYLSAKSQATGIPIYEIPYHIIAIETFPPYDVFPYTLSEKTITEGIQKLEEMCIGYKKYILNISSEPYYKEFKLI